jgi:hypothetical protein
LLQDNQISFELLESLDCLYKAEYEDDPNVRKLWYLICYHFFPKINKDWKQCLEGSRILQQTFMYEKLTTSDEAMTLWMIKIWNPKMKEHREKGWPDNTKIKTKKGIKQGEQELKNGLSDYIKFHTLITNFKDIDKGMVACRWNAIFWEELVTHNPQLFKKPNLEDQSGNVNHLIEKCKGEVLVLPGIDNNNHHQSMNLLNCYNMHKTLKVYNTDTNNGIQHSSTSISTDSNDNGNIIQKENNNNGAFIFEEHEITNPTKV